MEVPKFRQDLEGNWLLPRSFMFCSGHISILVCSSVSQFSTLALVVSVPLLNIYRELRNVSDSGKELASTVASVSGIACMSLFADNLKIFEDRKQNLKILRFQTQAWQKPACIFVCMCVQNHVHTSSSLPCDLNSKGGSQREIMQTIWIGRAPGLRDSALHSLKDQFKVT